MRLLCFQFHLKRKSKIFMLFGSLAEIYFHSMNTAGQINIILAVAVCGLVYRIINGCLMSRWQFLSGKRVSFISLSLLQRVAYKTFPKKLFLYFSQNQNNIQQPKVSNNVQKLSMLPGNVEAEAASKIVKDHLPSNNITSEIKKSSLSDRRLSKEYFRDVRLSLDASKPITPTMDNGSLPFHSNSFSSRKNFSIQSSSASNSESSCDNCVRRSIEQYKPIFKHLVQRPLFCFSLWAMFYIFWGDDALPGGSLFALTILELAALFLGILKITCTQLI